MGDTMLNIEERESIINETIERVYKAIPDIISNLLTTQSHVFELKRQFMEDNPSFKNHAEIVRQVVGKVEGENLNASFKRVLELSVPIIKKQIELKDTLDMGSVSKSKLDLTFTDNGIL